MYNTSDIAERLKILCDKHGVSVNKMLTDSGAGARLYYNLLRGSFPSIEKFAKIADYFDCSVDYLLGRSDERNDAEETTVF